MKIIFLITGILIFITSGILTYKGFNNPFGWQFWIFPYMALVSLIGIFFLSGGILRGKIAKWKRIIGSALILLSIIFSGLTLTAFYDYRIFLGQKAPRNLSKEKWKADLDYFEQRLTKEHKDFFSLVAQEDFKKAVEEFRAKIDGLNDDECKIEFLKLSAMANDGHTMLFPVDFAADFHFFPVSIYYFSDGYYVVKAADQYQSAVGKKVVKVGNLPIEEVFQKLKTFIGAENDWNKRDRFQMYLGVMAELLHTQKIIEEKNICSLTLQDEDGKEFVKDIKSEPFFTYFYWSIIRSAGNEISPVFPNFREDWYWFKYDEQTENLYLQITQLNNQKSKESFTAFIERLGNEIEKQKIGKLIIDIRANMGGNNQIFGKLIEILRQPKINQPGKLFLLTGRKTYSAGVNLTSVILNQTKAIVIGEPTGEGHNQFGDSITFSLPNSQLKIQVSKVLHLGSIAEDKSKTITPDILVEYNHLDFLKKIDPALRAVENFQLSAYKSETDNPRITEIPQNFNQPFSQTLAGSYLFKDSYLATLSIDDNNKPLITITDFTRYSLFRIKSQLYPISDSVFLTQLNKVKLEISGNQEPPILNWNGLKLPLKKVPEGFKLPMELINEGKLEEGLTLYKSNPLLINNNTEAAINGVGYEYLGKKDFQNALMLLKAVTEIFPQSANAYDSLAEANLAIGNKDEAIKNYEKALTLNPNNQSSIRALENLTKIRTN